MLKRTRLPLDFEKPLIINQVLLLAFQCILYCGVQYLEGTPADMTLPADRMIPFVPPMIIGYLLWFPMIAFFPLLLHHFSKALYRRHMAGLVLLIVLSCLIYLVYPTTVDRGDLNDTPLSQLVFFIYTADKMNLNCMPSMHCSMCFMMLFSALACKESPAVCRYGTVVLSLFVVASTLFVKQHVIIDAVTAFPLALLCWLAGGLIARQSFRRRLISPEKSDSSVPSSS